MAASPPEDIAGDELHARYIFERRHIRGDGTVKPDSFVPYRHVELSVTRHIGLTEERIWEIGSDVARMRSKPLRGRAEAVTSVFTSAKLQVVAAPIEDNLNHANVVNWPADKESQKALAQQIVRSVEFVPPPD